MSPTSLLIVYCVSIIAGSLVGGVIPHLIRLTHTRLQLAMSFIGGAMLGVGLLHLLPHAHFQFHAIYPAVSWLMAGFVAMFFVERVFHFHHHEVLPDRLPPTADQAHGEHGENSHGHEHDGHHHHELASCAGRISIAQRHRRHCAGFQRGGRVEGVERRLAGRLCRVSGGPAA
jgi:zinc and cadmium transporter